jgi:hypothetical protein
MSGPVLVGKVLAVIVAGHLFVETVLDSVLGDLSRPQELFIATAGLACSSVPVLWLLVVRPLRRMVEAEQRATAQREASLRAEADRQDFDARLHRALEMAATEDASYAIVRRTLERALAQNPAELLLADSSDAHLKRAVHAGLDGNGPGCAVESPHACPAIRRGQTLRFRAKREGRNRIALDTVGQPEPTPASAVTTAGAPASE